MQHHPSSHSETALHSVLKRSRCSYKQNSGTAAPLHQNHVPAARPDRVLDAANAMSAVSTFEQLRAEELALDAMDIKPILHRAHKEQQQPILVGRAPYASSTDCLKWNRPHPQRTRLAESEATK